VVDHDPAWTRLCGKLECLGLSCALVLHTDVGELTKVARAFAVFVLDTADEHAETGFEGGYFGGLRRIEERVGHVVYHLC
jgi:hypothetical protein